MLNILIVLAIVVLALVAIIMRRPDSFHVTRSAVMHATPDTVFPHINNLSNWKAWSPWSRMDPDAKVSTDGPAEGIGASHSWDGKKTGKGTMTILESRPNDFIKIRLDFQRPMKATNYAEFKLEPQGDKTKVTWSLYGENNFVGKAFSLIINCDKMIGGQYEEGLQNLAEIVDNT